MADTITFSGNLIQIIPVAGGLSNFDIATYYPGVVRVAGIGFYSATAADLIKVRNKTSSGAFIAPHLDAQSIIGFSPAEECCPYILATDCTLTDPANCVITFYLV
jgi:hypothetical protein